MRRIIILFIFLTVTGGITGLYFLATPHQMAPDLTLTLLDGQKLPLDSLRKRPVLVYFWATTCATCIEEIPLLTTLYHEFSSQGLHIIGIAMYYDPPNRVVYFNKNNQLPYLIAFDLERTAAQAFGGVKFVPSHFLMDQQGKIVYTRKGKLNESSLRQQIVQLLKNG